MPDVLTPEQRKLNMSRIRGQDTKPERFVRSLLYSLGYRYRLNVKKLPGKPDLVFTKRRKIVFVHGCFFHKHDCSYGTVVPKTNAEFWRKKREGNRERDKRNEAALIADGWQILIVWECMTKTGKRLELSGLLQAFLGPISQ